MWLRPWKFTPLSRKGLGAWWGWQCEGFKTQFLFVLPSVAFPFLGPRWLLQILPSVGNMMSLKLIIHWPEHSTWPYQAGDCDL